MSSRIEILGLEIPATVVEKLEAREDGRIFDWEAFEVLWNEPLFIRNRGDRTGQYLMIGKTEAGRLLTFPILPTDEEGIWKVTSGWLAKQSERTVYESNRGG